MKPKLSFVVPCYRLGHLLSDCIGSILSQTYGDFEVLIMDDCSPDNTQEVAAAFTDARVRLIRNELNIGHLRNYNKGVALASGDYIWLISADDRLRVPYALERYVEVLESHPTVAFAFCPAVELVDGKETKVIRNPGFGDHDAIWNGRSFLKELVRCNSIVAPSVMARRTDYVKYPFPEDMPWGGDWYLWCMFALGGDVAYVAEPMVNYRRHDLSMTSVLMSGGLEVCASDDIRIPWMVKRRAREVGDSSLAQACLSSVAAEYAHCISSRRYRTSESRMTLTQFEESLAANCDDRQERAFVRSRVYLQAADRYCWQEQYSLARRFYWLAIRKRPWVARAWLRWLVLSTGHLGIAIRRAYLRACGHRKLPTTTACH